MKSEYEYVMSIGHELGQHLGQWIAVVGEEIVATGDTAKEVYEKAKEKYPDKEPFIMKIPKETVMLL
jgi:hypothetical protein